MAKAMAHSQGKNTNEWLGYIGEIDELTRSRLAEKKKIQRNVKRKGSSDKIPEPTKSSDYTDLLASFVETDLDELGKQP